MSKIKTVIDLLKMAGIDASKYIGKVDPNKVKLLIPKNQKTAAKPKLISALNKDKATFSDALNVFENDAKYLSQMNEMELVNFANNLNDYFKVGGKVKWKPSNVVTTEGTPVVGKKLETLAKRKGAAGEVDKTTLGGAMKGLMTLVDELKGISPKMRNQMDRDELVAFIRKMRGRDFTNQEIKWVREYMDEFDIGLAKEKASGMQIAKKLGAKDKEEFEFITEYLDNVQTTSPEKFREMYGNVKNVNMDINTSIENKLEKHFKKKFKWDDTKKDGGLDDATFTKYEDELYEAQTEFMDFHRTYDSNVPFGESKYQSWSNNPKNYLDEASEKLKSITGEGLNTNFWKNYTDEVLTKYPKPEKFQYGGIAGMLGERPGYHRAGIVHAIAEHGELEKDLKRWIPGPMELKYMDRRYPKETYRPYKSLEDVPPEVLAILMKDPTFDPKAFLEMDWAAPGHTIAERKYRGDEKKVGKLPLGAYSGMTGEIYLNFPKFSEGEKGKVPAPMLDFDKMSNEEKAQVILHEMRHKNILEKKQLYEAQPEWVKKYPGGIDYAKERAFTTQKGPEITEHPGVKYKELEKGFIPEKYLTGHELFNWFMDARKFGTPKGKEWYPYFDKILKDHWEPHAKEIDKRSLELKSKPEHLGLAGGGLAGMLGEPTYQDEDHRVPYDSGKFVEKKDLPSGLKAEVGDPTPGWGLSDLVSRYFLYKEVLPGVSETTQKYLTDKLLKDLNDQGYSPKDFKAYIDEQFPGKAGGGRVPLKWGKTVKGIAELIEQFFPGTTKIGKRSKPYPEKVQEKMDLRKAIAGFYEREKAAKFKEMIKNKYQGRIDDALLNKMLVDNNPQRIAEVMATIDEALIMQGKGMGPETIMTTLRDSWKRKKNASGGRVPLSGGGGIMKLLKLLKPKPKKTDFKTLKKELDKFKRVDLPKLLKEKDKIPVYSGSMKRGSNTWEWFEKVAKDLGTTPEKIAKDQFKGQWFTPFKSYAKVFANPEDLTAKMRTVELTPKEIKIAKRYVEKVNKKDIISMKKKLGIKPAPKHEITTDENLVLIPRYKLKQLKKAKRIKTDYLIKEKIKEKLGLAEGGVAGMLGE